MPDQLLAMIGLMTLALCAISAGVTLVVLSAQAGVALAQCISRKWSR